MSLSDYIADYYGECSRGPGCVCNVPGHPWLGRACLNWKPLEAESWEILIELMKATTDGHTPRT